MLLTTQSLVIQQCQSTMKEVSQTSLQLKSGMQVWHDAGALCAQELTLHEAKSQYFLHLDNMTFKVHLWLIRRLISHR